MTEHTETHAVFRKPALMVGSERHELPLGLFRIGRDPQNNLVLEDSALSRHHFAIDVQACQAQLIDLGSANGTWVNKKRVRSAWLKDGDKIKIGDQTFAFEAPGFILSHAIFDDAEQTHSKQVSSKASRSFVPMLALCVAVASLFVQLLNREHQMDQDHFLTELKNGLERPVAAVPVPVEAPVLAENNAELQWKKAVSDFKAGDEDEACASIKSLLEQTEPKDLLHAKAQSFFERKCVL